MSYKKFKIGIDFGGVLSIHDSKITNDAGLEHKNTAINMPFAIDNLKKLKEQGHELYIISFCGKSRANETRTSIEKSGLSDLFTAQYYVKDRSYKNELCQYIGCHFMIDDNAGILDNIKTYNKSITTILFDTTFHSSHKCVKDWNILSNLIESTDYFTPVKSDNNIDHCIYK